MTSEAAITNLLPLHPNGTTYAVVIVYVAFYGFFRASEILPNLNWSDVVLSLNRMFITLHQSKTDSF